MARSNDSKNIVVGAGQFLVTANNTFRTEIPRATAVNATLQTSDNIADTAWYSVGYTTEGTNVTIEPTYGEAMVDQLLDVARLYKTSMRVTAATSFAEATFENLLVALNADANDVAKGPASAAANQAVGVLTPLDLSGASSAAFSSTATSAGGQAVAASAFAQTASLAADAAKIAHVYNINGGALGYAPVERSICVVAAGPQPTAATDKCDRIYIGFRAFQMDATAIPVRRDEMTVFPVSFRMLPYEGQGGRDGSALYGRIVDRIYTPAT